MGLDSYFYTLTPLADPRLAKVNLCGGMMSSNGTNGSFRGKVYSPFLEHITNNSFSLYKEEQTPDDYGPVIDHLRQWLKDNPDGGCPSFALERKEIEDLLLLFEVAFDKKALLHGWW